ncbi:MAG: DegT/DnrJ/EryC1/StrS family aminotransferase [Eubacteriales bacterium]|nr:DegT/DnrJ/EryC1/StrS family aminotransferase [Eubacteriales bacterium]
MENRICLSTPTIHGEEQGFIQEAFEKNWIGPLGFNCDGFEAEMTSYLHQCGAGYEPDLYAFAANSGTSALHLAIKLAGVKRGEHVLCSDMTFAATLNPVTYEGGVQVFVDSERETWNMDPAALEKAFEKYPDARVVLLVHLYGTPAKMDEIMEICKAHNAILIEDAAEALSSTYHGRACGTFGDLAAFSFNGNKIITSSCGGMLISRTREQREKAFFWATQAREKSPWYEHKELGYNYRMSNILAGIGRGQLLHLEEHRKRKEEIYRRYEAGLKDLPISMNPYLPESSPNFWLSCILLDKDCGVSFMDVMNRLAENNVETRPIWKPMHMQPFYADRDFVFAEKTPVNEDIFSRGLCIPSDIKMTDEEQDYVIQLLHDFIGK